MNKETNKWIEEKLKEFDKLITEFVYSSINYAIGSKTTEDMQILRNYNKEMKEFFSQALQEAIQKSIEQCGLELQTKLDKKFDTDNCGHPEIICKCRELVIEFYKCKKEALKIINNLNT